MEKKRVAIIGTGVAGLTASFLLKDKFSLTLFEKNSYIGGHTHTVTVDDPKGPIPVDTGFIVMNNKNYPYFTKLLKKLDIELQDSNMSFGHYDKCDESYYSTDNLRGLFSNWKNIFNPKYYMMLFDILRFFKQANKDLKNDKRCNDLKNISLGAYLNRHSFGDKFIHSYLIPMGAAIWSTPTDEMMEFPASSFLNFFKNHGLLSSSNHPQWKTIKGGSHQYVKKILSLIDAEIIKGDPVSTIDRQCDNVVVKTQSGLVREFDKVIVATHADEALSLLADPTSEETRLLSKWSYSINNTFLHSSTSLVAPKRSGWASWNFIRSMDGKKLTLTYNMKKLQNLNSTNEYFVSLNPPSNFDNKTIIKQMIYTHPQYTSEAIDTQKDLPAISGCNRTYFCGSYHGYGFHEDAVRSAVMVSRMLGVNEL